jgi:hypothetical protein
MAEILAPIDQFIDDKNCSDIVILADKTICQFSLLNLSDLAKALRFCFLPKQSRALNPARHATMVRACSPMALAEAVTAIAALGISAVRRFA